jgi:hypothetical protein
MFQIVGGNSRPRDICCWLRIFVRATTFCALLTVVAGCAVVRPLHLYPTNGAAEPAVLQGQLVGHGQLHGTIDITMPDGEALQGDYSIVAGGSIGFGSVFGTVYGGGGVASGTGTSTSVAMSAEGQGSASLVENAGTSMQCEFLNNNMTGHGYGACRSSKGSVYRLIY